MKRDFTNENFERFLKQSADNLRMKAPDKVWQNLSSELNKRRRRFIFGLGTFLLITTAAGYYTISNVSYKDNASGQVEPVTTPANVSVQYNTNNVGPQSVTKSALPKPVPGNFITPQPVATKNVRHRASDISLVDLASADITLSDPKDVPSEKDIFSPTIVDSYPESDSEAAVENAVKQSNFISSSQPLTIESVINTYKLKNKRSKLETQFYFAPTISYRKLTENKSYLRKLGPGALPSNYPAMYGNVSNNVTHKPDIGFEVGFTTKLKVSERLKIRSGIQFNVNRYDVKAFSSPVAVTTIALNNGVRVDSLNTISTYSNSNIHGYKPSWLQNFSFQVSAPVGMELTFKGNDKIQFGIGSTIQPTYVLGDRSYLITTDYKNYTQVPWLIRRWNVNTALETFVTYNAGKTKWQVGPQVRYQLLSSFISEYPVKENLFDFGLKLGISLNK